VVTDLSFLVQRVRQAALSAVIGRTGSQALRLLSNLILTRLLFPEAFGLMAIVTAVMTGLQLFSDLGVGPSVIQNESGEEADSRSGVAPLEVARLGHPLARSIRGGARRSAGVFRLLHHGP
jgi:hypothetical protein